MIRAAMVHSMTAFAQSELEAGWGAAAWELRSVNHRYLDVSLRLPEELRALEPRVRERIGARVRRGKVDAQLRLQLSHGGARAGDDNMFELDRDLLTRLLTTAFDIRDRYPDAYVDATPPGALEALRWPGVVVAPALDRESAGETALKALDGALEELIATRAREGAKLGDLIAHRCDEVAKLVGEVRGRLPEVRERTRERLQQRIEELREGIDAAPDPERVARELVLFADRHDVTEELDRLEVHVAEVRTALTSGDAIGRRLDFLMQELNREANTLGAKLSAPDIGQAPVELKVLIEQMREQVQNIE